VGEGKSSKEVATLLGICTKTAESHRSRIMQKFDIHETARPSQNSQAGKTCRMRKTIKPALLLKRT
jgi:DNA-binding NarL/FixJ family response regulator